MSLELVRQEPWKETFWREVGKFYCYIFYLIPTPVYSRRKEVSRSRKPAPSTLLLYRASFHPYTLPYATVRSRYSRPVFYRKISKIKYNNNIIIIHQKESIHIKNKYFRSGNILANDPQHHNTPASPLHPTASVCVRMCSEGPFENLPSSLLRTRDYSRPRLEKCHDFHVPAFRSNVKWGLTFVVWRAGVDIAPCEQ